MTEVRGDIFNRDPQRLIVRNALKAATAPIIDMLSDSGIFLEVACGTGFFNRELMPERFRLGYIGLDFSSASLSLFKNQKANVQLVEGSVDALPFPSESVTAIVGYSAYPVINYYDNSLAEAYRVLKPGGRLALIQDSGIGFTDKKNSDKETKPKVDLTEDHHQKLLKKARETGFEVVSGIKHSHGVAVVDYHDFESRIPEKDRNNFFKHDRSSRNVFNGYSLLEAAGTFEWGNPGQFKKDMRDLESEVLAPTGMLYKLKLTPGKQVFEYVRVRYIVAEKPAKFTTE